MIDGTDLSEEKKWFHEERARVAVANLQKHNINAQYVPSREEALSAVMEMIPRGATVARGDSITVEQVKAVLIFSSLMMAPTIQFPVNELKIHNKK